MKRFACVCGQQLFYENTTCLRCGRQVGFDVERTAIVATEPEADLGSGALRTCDEVRKLFRRCRNGDEWGVCNWLVPLDSTHERCRSCGLNTMIPNLSKAGNRDLWSDIELAKRRLLYSLLRLDLPFEPSDPSAGPGLRFSFLEDRRSNPDVAEQAVLTGYSNGLVTLNVAEADALHRVRARAEMNEPYRTVLGHFRHETGHFFWEILVARAERREGFRALFGDEREDYAQALASYYATGAPADWENRYISAYASAHPLEDWAETWAHYLHMVETLETAASYGLEIAAAGATFDNRLDAWTQIVVLLNELTRSLGIEDPYPFALATKVRDKLRFIDEAVTATAAAS